MNKLQPGDILICTSSCNGFTPELPSVSERFGEEVSRHQKDDCATFIRFSVTVTEHKAKQWLIVMTSSSQIVEVFCKFFKKLSS